MRTQRGADDLETGCAPVADLLNRLGMRRTNWVVWPCCALVATLGGVGCNNKDDTRPTSSAALVGPTRPVHQVGQLANNGYFELSVQGVQACSVEPHLQPPTSVKRVGVQVLLRGVGQEAIPANPFYATIIGPAGERFEATLAGCQPVLAAQQLAERQSATGWISFDVPQTLSQAQFSYAPALIGANKPELVFDIQL
jgi:hypothetical protein